MLEKLDAVERKYDELSQQLGDAELIESPEKYRKVAQAHAELREIVDKYRERKALAVQLEDTRSIFEEDDDDELLALAGQEIQDLEQQLQQCEADLKILLLPKDPNDEKSVVLEIRAGTGGDEATLFAQEIFRMYARYAEGRRWRTELVSVHHSSIGGFKEVVATIEGKAVYGSLKFESGVHRVQRVPETDTQGRVHTSAVTVAVLPEAGEVEVQIDPPDLRIDTYCSSGPGGQSVNTTYSAVRITHIPTGEVVTCQDEKSQIKNKARAMKVLRSRLFERALQEQQSQITETRRAMIGRGDRSEKIRTYNFPQNRITDHRLGLTLHKLASVMEGQLDAVIDALITSSRAETLKNLS